MSFRMSSFIAAAQSDGAGRSSSATGPVNRVDEDRHVCGRAGREQPAYPTRPRLQLIAAEAGSPQATKAPLR